MRGAIAGCLLLLAGGGCAAGALDQPSRGDPATCLALFETYDRVVRTYPSNTYSSDDPATMVPGPVVRPARLLIVEGCRTSAADLDGLPALAAQLAGHRVVDSGAAIPPTVVHLGIVTGIEDEREVTRFFRGLGYRSRGIGAPTLGRRLYIGTFTSQGALDEAMSIARQAGFIAPMSTTRTKL